MASMEAVAGGTGSGWGACAMAAAEAQALIAVAEPGERIERTDEHGGAVVWIDGGRGWIGRPSWTHGPDGPVTLLAEALAAFVAADDLAQFAAGVR